MALFGTVLPMADAIRLAKRLEVVKPSATVAIAQRAAELQRQGVDVLSFSLGEPDFDAPTHVCEAAKRAVDAGAHHYTAVQGILELREAIAADSASRRKVRHTAEEVVVSVGAKHTLFNLALALYDEGDEVLIPAPYWVSYPEQALIVGARPVTIPTSVNEGYRLTPRSLQGAITPRTKAFVLCSPSNPTGAAYTKEQLVGLADVCRSGAFWIIADEIYDRLVYGGFRQHSILEVAPDLKDRIIVVDGVSKTYAMTGWRIGWMLAPERVAKACIKVQGQSTTNPTAVAQHAALAAITGPQEPVERMRQAFERRRGAVVDGLNAIPGIRCRLPEGAFYAFADVSALVGRRAAGKVLDDDVAIATWLLETARCAVVPGSPFGAPGHVRISYATSDANIREGLSRIAAAVAAIE
jgi:aspartate aminotransferase